MKEQETTQTPPGILKAVLSRWRLIGCLEAISFLALLGIAMPLKYYADMPLAVRIVGSLHGVLFILYVIAILRARTQFKWSGGRVVGGLASSVLPFGPFVFDAWVRREDSV